MNKKIYLLLLLGILLRLFLASSTFHPDIRAFQLGGQVVASGNILNLYDYLYTLPQNSQIIKVFGPDLFIYPPLIYLLNGFFYFIWVNILGLHFVGEFLIENNSFFGNLLFNWHLLFVKLPYLIFDILTAFIFYKIFPDHKTKLLGFGLWLFNPVNLYVTYMMGQFDIIAVFFSVLSLYFIKKRQISLSAFSLGWGIAFKIYPLFLLIALVVYGKTFWKKLEIIILGLAPYVISILPYLSSHGFRSSALVAGQTLKSLYAAVPISGGESILLFPAFLLAFYTFLFINQPSITKLWESYFIILLLFFIFTHYHPQWFLWITPFFLISLLVCKFKNYLAICLSLFSFFGLLFFFDSSLTVNIFAPLLPPLHSLPSIWQILRLNVDYNFSRSLLQTLFVSAAIYLIYAHFPHPEQDKMKER